LQELARVQAREVVVQQQEIRTPHIVLRGQLVKKVQRTLPTLQHLQDEGHLMGMEHPRDAVHIRRIILYHGDEKRGEGFGGLHAQAFPYGHCHAIHPEVYRH
jgi:hypothetical protein